ncbi:hypothetical protein CEXT_489961 [Caerostris extrusa]|uniref:Uncharacterized protein n=1 Tax=Caerostris extrusa TaxID=172846 RepID=A0AAV4Y243_CAEEX|nr:hypothetical protein CEXT_489961 [Caerostris extrusa]
MKTPPQVTTCNWRDVQEWMSNEANAEMLDGMEFAFKNGVLKCCLSPPKTNKLDSGVQNSWWVVSLYGLLHLRFRIE